MGNTLLSRGNQPELTGLVYRGILGLDKNYGYSNLGRIVRKLPMSNKLRIQMSIAQVWRIMDQGASLRIERMNLDEPTSNLDEISSQIPSGVYTTFRTFGHNSTLPLEPQFRRLEESANLMNQSISLNRGGIRKALRQVVESYTEPEMRIRLTLDLDDQPGVIYISIEPLITPIAEDYDHGVITRTQQVERKNPKAKHTSFLSYADKVRQKISGDVNEILMIDYKGQILEGLSSNFFAVKRGEIWTEEEQVLSGIVRSIVLEEARAAGIRVHLGAVCISEVDTLEEAFLTSASRSVLPIRKIDEHLIGMGKPGSVTKKIMELYHQHIKRRVIEI